MVKRIPFDISIKYVWPSVSNPFLTYEWFETWFATLGQDWQPYFLKSGNVLAPLARIGDLVMFAGDTSVTDYHDLVGPAGQIEQAWKEIIPFLKKENISEIKFDNIRQDSPTLSYFRGNNHFTISQENTTPILPLPKTWDQYLAGLDSHYRHELRRKVRRFEEKYHKASIANSNHIDTLTRLMKLNAAKKEFLTSPTEEFLRKIAKVLEKHIIINTLTADGEVAAATISFIFDKTHFLYNSGFDDKNFSGAGFYLNVMLIKEAVESGLSEFNFLRGPERYKYDLGAKDLPIYTIKANILGD